MGQFFSMCSYWRDRLGAAYVCHGLTNSLKVNRNRRMDALVFCSQGQKAVLLRVLQLPFMVVSPCCLFKSLSCRACGTSAIAYHGKVVIGSTEESHGTLLCGL